MAPSLLPIAHLSGGSLALIATLMILVLAIPVVGAITARRLRMADVASSSKIARYLRTIAILWSITALALYALHLYGEGPSDVGVRPPHAWIEILAGFSVVAAMLVLGRGRTGAVGQQYARRVGIVLPQTPCEWALFVVLAATAGVCEEFLYRGYALTKIAELSGSLALGVILSSAAFGIAHSYQGRMGMIGTGIAGLLYALVFVATGSLLPCMLGHFAQDIAGAVVLTRRLRHG